MATLNKSLPLRGEAVLPALPIPESEESRVKAVQPGVQKVSPALGSLTGGASSELMAHAQKRPMSSLPGQDENPSLTASQDMPPALTNTETKEAMSIRLREAHSDALTALEEKAFREGYAAGLRKGEEKGQEKYLLASAALRKILDSANTSIAKTISDAEEIVGAIVFEAVCKIVGDLLVTKEGVGAVVSQVVSRAKQDELISIKVSAGDLEHLLLRTPENAQASSTNGLGGVKYEADEHVELGGCIVQLKYGYIDGRIETQFRSFAQSLKEAAHRRQ